MWLGLLIFVILALACLFWLDRQMKALERILKADDDDSSQL